MDAKDIKISDYLYELATSEYARMVDEKENNLVLQRFLSIYGTMLDAIKDKVDDITMLVDIQDVPDEFLPYIGSLIGYDYNYSLSAGAQRSLISRTLDMYRKKGTREAILDIVSVYDPYARIYEPYVEMARYSRKATKYSGTAKIEGDYYRTGIFEIQLNATDADYVTLIPLVEEHRPAGKKVLYKRKQDAYCSAGFQTFAVVGTQKFLGFATTASFVMSITGVDAYTNLLAISDAMVPWRIVDGSPVYGLGDVRETDTLETNLWVQPAVKVTIG